MEVLKQGRNAPVAVEDQVCILYAVTKDYLKDVEVADIAEYQALLFERMHAQQQDVLDVITSTGKLESDTEKQLAAAIGSFTQDFIASKAQGE